VQFQSGSLLPYFPYQPYMEIANMADNLVPVKKRSSYSEGEETPRVAKISSFPLNQPDGAAPADEYSKFSGTPLAESTIESVPNPKQALQAQQALVWREAMCEYFNLRRGYSQVSVLLIRWEDDIADPRLEAAEESRAIRNCFENNFHFTTITIVLSKEWPQQKLLEKVSNICSTLDEDSLFILYYNGHGSHEEPYELKLHP
jgi:hypothetical protein